MEDQGEVLGRKPCDRIDNIALFCFPCELDGTHAEAFGYCQDCREHLCETCFLLHTRPTLLRHHVMLDSATMPKVKTSEILDDKNEFCDIHKKEQITFYCAKDDKVICSVCISEYHRSCQINYIPGIAKEALQNGELQMQLEQFTEVTTKYKSEVQKAKCQSKQENDDNHMSTLQDIICFRNEINESVDKIEKAMRQQVNIMSKTEVHKIDEWIKSTELKLSTLETAESDLKKCKDQNKVIKLFVLLKKTKRLVKTLTSEHEFCDHSAISKQSFVRNPTILNILSREEFGTLISPPKTISIINATDIYRDDHLIGIAVISAAEIIVMAKEEKYSKLMRINVKEKRIIRQLQLSKEPNDCACLPQEKLAVTFCHHNSEIRFYSLSSNDIVEIHSEYGFQGPSFLAHGISYFQDKLYVTSPIFDLQKHGGIWILNMDIDALYCFGGPEYTLNPNYIEINKDGKYLYVSDLQDGTVKRFDMRGNIINVFKVPKNKKPRKIQVLDDGTVLVHCSDNVSGKLVRLTHDLKICNEFVLSGIISICSALAYCRETNRLFVACRSPSRGKRANKSQQIVKSFEVHTH